MSISKVTADINGDSYNLNKSESESDDYNVSINAPSSIGNYRISINATDDAGNVTTVSSDDEKYRDMLTLKVNYGPDSVDLKDYILTNELGKRMFNMVSPIYENSKIALYLFNAIGTVMSQDINFVKGDFISQIFPQTATWGLRYWEDAYGIITDVSKTYEERRTYLMSVMYNKNPATPYHLEKIVTGITNLKCKVTENIEPNTFLVSIMGYYKNVQEIKDELNKKAPAHLNYIVRMADIAELYSDTLSGFAVSECERYELEVNN